MKPLNLNQFLKIIYIIFKELFIVASFFAILICVLEDLQFGLISFWFSFKTFFIILIGEGVLTLILSQFVKSK